MPDKRMAKIMVSKELILQWLDFSGGDIVRADVGGDVVFLTVAHPDLPEAKGEYIEIVTPEYQSEYCITSVRRTWPPKREVSNV